MALLRVTKESKIHPLLETEPPFGWGGVWPPFANLFGFQRKSQGFHFYAKHLAAIWQDTLHPNVDADRRVLEVVCFGGLSPAHFHKLWVLEREQLTVVTGSPHQKLINLYTGGFA